MVHASPPGQTARPQRATGARARFRQVAWACVPLLSLSVLAFAPFLWLALIRRQARDWAVLAAYAAAFVLWLVLISVGKPGSATSDIAVAIIVAVWVTATAHALVAFRPTAGVPSWRDVHAIRAAGKRAIRRQRLAKADARQSEVHARATEARAAMAGQKQARKAGKAAAQAARAEARSARKAGKAAAQAPRAEERSARKAELATARAAAAEAKQSRRREKAAKQAAIQAEQQKKRDAARAAKLAEPRYGWVETRRTYRSKTIFGNRRSETIVSRPSERNARRRTRQRFGVTITEEWRRLD